MKITKSYRIEHELIDHLKEAVNNLNENKSISEFKWTETSVIETLIDIYLSDMIRDIKQGK